MATEVEPADTAPPSAFEPGTMLLSGENIIVNYDVVGSERETFNTEEDGPKSIFTEIDLGFFLPLPDEPTRKTANIKTTATRRKPATKFSRNKK